MRLSRMCLVMFSAPLLLTGCGDGWEAQRTTEVFPYGNKRTAGSGVVYVRAKMLPEKELVVEAAEPEMKSAEEVFTRAQTKGVAASEPVEKAQIAKPEKQDEQDKTKEVIQKSFEKDPPESSVEPADGGDKEILEKVKEKASDSGKTKQIEAPKKSYEQMLDEKHGSVAPTDIEPQAGSSFVSNKSSFSGSPTESLQIITVPEEVSIGSKPNKSVLPMKEIRSPMMDVYDREYEAEKSLEEIYSNPF